MDKRITNISLRHLLRSLADFFMPRGCVVCGRQLLAGEEHLCSCCLAELPFTHFESMPHNPMADKYNALVTAPAYERAAALFFYKGDYGRIAQALKYKRNFGAGRWAARMLGERLAGSGLWNDVDLVCCVPLHWTRLFSRGYNQAEIIAREVARALLPHSRLDLEPPRPHSRFRHSRLDLEPPRPHSRRALFRHSRPALFRHSRPDRESPAPVLFVPKLLRRTRRTGTQTRLTAEERGANVAGAFRVNRAAMSALWCRGMGDCRSAAHGSGGRSPTQGVSGGPPPVPWGCRGIGDCQSAAHVLLIDDVFTTGATLASCSAALRAAFGPSVRISVATLGYAEQA